MESLKAEIKDEIRELNLAYLMLAKQIISHDKKEAAFRLGVDSSVVEMLDGLSRAQVIKLASSPMVLTQFRFAETHVWDLITVHDKRKDVAAVHSAVLRVGKKTEGIELA